jgi:hypothetical protein
MTGLTATTPRYTPRNQRGPKGRPLRRTSPVPPHPPACRTTWIPVQVPRKTREGFNRRAARRRRKAPVLSPRALLASRLMRLEKPPTKKNTGMICRIQVSILSCGDSSSRLRCPIRPPLFVITVPR